MSKENPIKATSADKPAVEKEAAAAKPSAAAKPTVKKTVKQAVKPAVKKTTAKKATVKTAAAKRPAKTATKPAAKPAVKPAAKKPVAKAAKPVTKPAVSVKVQKTAAKPVEVKEKVKKPKLVRDSFTMPEAEYQVLSDVKKAFLKTGVSVKKSELLRAGVALIRGMELGKLNTVIAALAPIKAGRPKKEK